MKKLATLLVSTALVGGLTITSFATTVSAAENQPGNQRGNFVAQTQQVQAQQVQGQGERRLVANAQGQNMRGKNMQGPNMQGPNMRGPGQHGPNMGPHGMQNGGLVHFTCSVNGAPLAEIALNNLSERLTLEEDQTVLFDAYRTAMLTAQTTFAESCETPVANAGAETPRDPVEMLKLRVTNQTANVEAIESVLPALEAFYDSLTDEQKTDLAPQPRGFMRVGQGDFGPGPGQNQGQGQPGNAGPNQGNFGPGQNQGQGPNTAGPHHGNFGPGQNQPGFGQPGQGFGPRNNN